MVQLVNVYQKNLNYISELLDHYKKYNSCIVGDVSNGLPWQNEYFDAIFAGEIIEHIIDTDFFLDEINRVLNDKGQVVLTTPNAASFTPTISIMSLSKSS